jgi:hypothetical protein
MSVDLRSPGKSVEFFISDGLRHGGHLVSAKGIFRRLGEKVEISLQGDIEGKVERSLSGENRTDVRGGEGSGGRFDG